MCQIKFFYSIRISIIIFNLGLIVPVKTNCQDSLKLSKTRIGFKTGYSISNIGGTEAELFTSPSGTLKKGHGFMAGILFVQYLKNELFSFHAEINYVKKGGKFENTIFYDANDKTVNYIQLPVSIAYDAFQGKHIVFTLEAGGAFNYAVRPVRYNPDNYGRDPSLKAHKVMVSPFFGGTLLIKSKTIMPFLTIRHEFDNAKYFSRESGNKKYYLQHAGYTSLSGGFQFNL